MAKKARRIGFIPFLFALLMLITLSVGCGPSYAPVQQGACGPGRSWVPPQTGPDGEARAGYCTYSDQQ
mgnify:CR=1 FL=1